MTAVMILIRPPRARVMTVTMPPKTCPRNSPSERHELVDSSVAEVESLVEPVSVFQALRRSPSASPWSRSRFPPGSRRR